MPAAEPIHRAMPGRLGLAPTGRRSAVARRIVLQGWLESRTRAEIAAARDALLPLADAGVVEIETALWPGVAWAGEFVSAQVAEFGPQTLARHPSCTLTFSCANPLGLDLEPRIVGWTSETDPAVIECGTGPSDLTVRIAGPATDPTVQIRDCRGIVVAALEFSITLGANDWLHISGETFQTTLVAAGVQTDAVAALVSGSPRLLTVDPALHADRAGGAWPTVHSTSGTGSVAYRRSWL